MRCDVGYYVSKFTELLREDLVRQHDAAVHVGCPQRSVVGRRQDGAGRAKEVEDLARSTEDGTNSRHV